MNHRESRSRNDLVDTYNNVCFDIDQLIALPNAFYDENDGVHRNNLSRKQDLISQITMQLHKVPKLDQAPNENLRYALELKRLTIFMPAFRARALYGKVHDDLVKQTHDNLVGYIASLDDMLHSRGMSNSQKKQMAAHLAECDVQGLSSRNGVLLWPALAREEASQDRKRLNHDLYALDSNNRKRMFQIKTSANGNGYDPRVVVIQHYGVLWAMRRDQERYLNIWEPSHDDAEFELPTPYVHEQILKGSKPDPISRLLVDEKAGGRRFDREKRFVLDLASSYVASMAR